MKKIKLSEILSGASVRRAVALMMALMLLTFAGCKSDPATSSEGGSSEPSKVESDNPSSDASASSSVPASTSSYINPLKGDITVDADIKSANIRTDAEEITPTVDIASSNYNFAGYAQKERNALRDEILNTKNTLEYYKPAKDAKIYYVSPGGNNANDGLSPETAIKTVDAVAGFDLNKGDFVLFERNSIFRLNDDFNLKTGIRYGSYGEGRKPMIIGSAKNFATEAWQPSKKKNVWQINYMYSYPCGAFFNEGDECGYLKTSLRFLEKNTDFYLDETTATLYLYCDKGNPANVWKSIEISQGVGLILSTGVNDVIVDNLCLRYMGDGGVNGHYNNNNWTVTNCEIGYTGGVDNGTVRFGNGIGTWVGGEYLYWNHNWVYQTFDSGMSPQGNVGKKLYDYHDISMSNNLFEYNNADIEIWEQIPDTLPKDYAGPSKMYNYYMDNNIHRFTSLGWGTRADDGGLRGIDGVIYGHSELMDGGQFGGHFSWNNNIIDCPGWKILSFNKFAKADFDAWERNGNTYYIDHSMRRNAQMYILGFKDIGESLELNASNKEKTIEAIKSIDTNATVNWYE